MSEALDRLAVLGAAGTRTDAVAALGDLGDLAYGRPGTWKGFTAELLLQTLAEEVDAAASEAIDWSAFSPLLSRASRRRGRGRNRGRDDDGRIHAARACRQQRGGTLLHA